MNGPALHGAIVYSKDIKKPLSFYMQFFGMVLVRETPEFIALEIEGFNIIVHKPPIEIPDENFNTVNKEIACRGLGQYRR